MGRLQCIANMNFERKNYVYAYVIIYGVIMLMIHAVDVPYPQGEWDDYTFPIASILNDHNFSISKSDVQVYKELFPEWSMYVDGAILSSFMAKDESGELTWYFPIYAIACIPYTLLLDFLGGVSTVYAFCLTNITIFISALLVVCNVLNVEFLKKLLLILVLTLNPIIFYIGWASAEVFIYSMLIIGLVFWYNRMYKRAAVFVSLAGMLNPVIMSIGFFMIFEYFWTNKKTFREVNCKECLTDVVKYLSCYFIGIIPMLYNYYNVGHINLTAAALLSVSIKFPETTLSRFQAYFFDLNYGFLPYFPILLILSFLLFFIAFRRKKWRYIVWMTAFGFDVCMYSIMVHINCGMSGISRYNAWGIAPLIFAVVLFYDEILQNMKIKTFINRSLLLGTVISMFIVVEYGVVCANKISYTSFTPIAKWALDNIPSLYNPLPSTFNSRIEHVDLGYVYKTPIAYVNDEGIVRKILVKKEDIDTLNDEFYVGYASATWFADKLKEIGEGEVYITCPMEYKVVKAKRYNIGRNISFMEKDFNASEYAMKGLSKPEEWGTWIDGHEYVMRLRVNTDSPCIHVSMNTRVFNDRQKIEIYINDYKNSVLQDYEGGNLEFDFDNPGKDKSIEIKFLIPNAVSPAKLGSGDTRTLGLGIINMVLAENKKI